MWERGGFEEHRSERRPLCAQVADASAEEVILLLKMTRYDFERIFHKKTDLETDNLKERRAWEVLSHIDLFGAPHKKSKGEG